MPALSTRVLNIFNGLVRSLRKKIVTAKPPSLRRGAVGAGRIPIIRIIDPISELKKGISGRSRFGRQKNSGASLGSKKRLKNAAGWQRASDGRERPRCASAMDRVFDDGLSFTKLFSTGATGISGQYTLRQYVGLFSIRPRITFT
ncbi:hypothetical protein [Roseiarcus sp.]|uniref:hypothetical protein n=1 Tax=Roseiarcus sp. TaxID=1969460 RepID=UPI003F9DD33D